MSALWNTFAMSHGDITVKSQHVSTSAMPPEPPDPQTMICMIRSILIIAITTTTAATTPTPILTATTTTIICTLPRTCTLPKGGGVRKSLGQECHGGLVETPHLTRKEGMHEMR